MKKPLALSATLLLTPLTALAISLSDIKDNTDEYVLVAQNSIGDYYVDAYSIASLRYDPPYYAMSGDMYIVSYATNSIIRSTLTATYDYNRCLKSLIYSESKSHPRASARYIFGLVLDEIEKYNGLTSYYGAADCWDLDGNYIDSLTAAEFNASIVLNSDSLDTDVTRCPLGSPVYHAANFMFYKGYNEYFSPKFDSKDLY